MFSDVLAPWLVAAQRTPAITSSFPARGFVAGSCHLGVLLTLAQLAVSDPRIISPPVRVEEFPLFHVPYFGHGTGSFPECWFPPPTNVHHKL